MALLDIRNLSIEIKTAHGQIRVVDNISLTLNEGEICGLVGESGSGKSLIAKVICNAFKHNWIISADRFRFNDIELLKLSPAKRHKLVGKEIAMIFQDPLTCLDPSKKIGRQIIQNIRRHSFKGHWWQRLGWKKQRAVELLHRVGIKDHKEIMNSYPHEITEGEGQKVMIAIAVANQPRLLIADEPTYSLEATTQLQIFRLLSGMNQNNGMTILWTSNDISSISEWCHRFVVLYCGQNVESGTTQNILETPHHPYTAALLHSIPDFSQPLPLKGRLNTLRGTIPLLQHMPIGCRLGPRCPFAQKKCGVKPPLRRLKQHEFACHYPLNMRENYPNRKDNSAPLTLPVENETE